VSKRTHLVFHFKGIKNRILASARYKTELEMIDHCQHGRVGSD